MDFKVQPVIAKGVFW